MEIFDAHVKCNRDIDLPFVAGLLRRLNSTSKAFARMNFARGNWRLSCSIKLFNAVLKPLTKVLSDCTHVPPVVLLVVIRYGVHPRAPTLEITNLRAPDSISICKILETKEAVRERRRVKSGRSMAEQRRKIKCCEKKTKKKVQQLCGRVQDSEGSWNVRIQEFQVRTSNCCLKVLMSKF